MNTGLRTDAAAWVRKWSVTVSLSMMLLSGGTLAQENKDLHTMDTMNLMELDETMAPCAEWVFKAREMAPVGKDEGREFIEKRERYVRASFPETSAGFILYMEILEAIEEGISDKAVQRRAMDKCREFVPRYVKKDGVDDPEPKRKTE